VRASAQTRSAQGAVSGFISGSKAFADIAAPVSFAGAAASRCPSHAEVIQPAKFGLVMFKSKADAFHIGRFAGGLPAARGRI
jgi:hypothetical protein